MANRFNNKSDDSDRLSRLDVPILSVAHEFGQILIKTRHFYSGDEQTAPDSVFCRAGKDIVPVDRIIDRREGQLLQLHGELDPNQDIAILIDLARRHNLCRLHTALHAAHGMLLSHFRGVVVTGSNVSSDYADLRFTATDTNIGPLVTFEAWLNERLEQDLAVSESFVGLADTRLGIGDRYVEIDGLDQQKCGGPHVKLTGDCGVIEVFQSLLPTGHHQLRLLLAERGHSQDVPLLLPTRTALDSLPK